MQHHVWIVFVRLELETRINWVFSPYSCAARDGASSFVHRLGLLYFRLRARGKERNVNRLNDNLATSVVKIDEDKGYCCCNEATPSFRVTTSTYIWKLNTVRCTARSLLFFCVFVEIQLFYFVAVAIILNFAPPPERHGQISCRSKKTVHLMCTNVYGSVVSTLVAG